MNLLPGRNRDTDIEKGHLDTVEERAGWDELGE